MFNSHDKRNTSGALGRCLPLRGIGTTPPSAALRGTPRLAHPDNNTERAPRTDAAFYNHGVLGDIAQLCKRTGSALDYWTGRSIAPTRQLTIHNSPIDITQPTNKVDLHQGPSRSRTSWQIESRFLAKVFVVCCKCFAGLIIGGRLNQHRDRLRVAERAGNLERGAAHRVLDVQRGPRPVVQKPLDQVRSGCPSWDATWSVVAPRR